MIAVINVNPNADSLRDSSAGLSVKSNFMKWQPLCSRDKGPNLMCNTSSFSEGILGVGLRSNIWDLVLRFIVLVLKSGKSVKWDFQKFQSMKVIEVRLTKLWALQDERQYCSLWIIV